MPMIVGSAAGNTGMAGAIYTQLTALNFINAGTASQGFCNAIAQAVVIYIQSNATVPGTGLVAPNGGGPVTGAASVT